MTGGQKKAKTAPGAIEAAERQAEALELRKRGLSLEAIAGRLGYSGRGAAYNAIRAGLDKTLREPADALRELELSRLDGMLERLAEPLAVGDLAAIAMALRISERRSRLLGLDRREAPLSVKLPRLERAEDAPPVVAGLLDKAAKGELLAEDAAKLAGLVSAYMKAAETADLAERIRKLEKASARGGAEKEARHESFVV